MGFFESWESCLHLNSAETRASMAKMQWMHKLVEPVAIGAAIFSEYYAIVNYGPLPGALLAGPVAGVVVFWLFDGVICVMEGRSFLLCPLQQFVEAVVNLAQQLVPGASFVQGIAGSIEKGALSLAGCKQYEEL